MKFCGKCGKRFKDSDKFCAVCGIELTQMEQEDEGMKATFSSAADSLGEKAKEVLSGESHELHA